MNRVLFIVILLLIPNLVSAGEAPRTFTNKDLEKYETPTNITKTKNFLQRWGIEYDNNLDYADNLTRGLNIVSNYFGKDSKEYNRFMQEARDSFEIKEYKKTDAEIQQEIESHQTWKEQSRQDENWRLLKRCIRKAYDSYKERWEKTCKAHGFIEECFLPSDTSQNYSQSLHRSKQECYRLYGD